MAGVDAPRHRAALAGIHAPLLFSAASPSHLRRRRVHVVLQQARPLLRRHTHIRLDVAGGWGGGDSPFPARAPPLLGEPGARGVLARPAALPAGAAELTPARLVFARGPLCVFAA